VLQAQHRVASQKDARSVLQAQHRAASQKDAQSVLQVQHRAALQKGAPLERASRDSQASSASMD
jgi:hypothetical protein